MRKLFAAFLVAFILLGGDLVLHAWAQGNTFCAANLACTVSALWTFSGGITSPSVAGTSSGLTYDISANTFKTSTNTAGHYPRNNGTQYVDATIAGADIPATTSNCSGVQFAQGLNAGHTPICATPPTFVASGGSHAVGYVPDPGSSAGTTHFLREDASWATIPSGGSTVLNAQGDAGAITGTGGVATVYTYTLPGGTVANLKAIRVTVGWSHSTGSANISYNVTLNGVTTGCNESVATARAG
jgi:hypothetical protein